MGKYGRIIEISPVPTDPLALKIPSGLSNRRQEIQKCELRIRAKSQIRQDKLKDHENGSGAENRHLI